jgi:AraC-like DNA-binding protein
VNTFRTVRCGSCGSLHAPIAEAIETDALRLLAVDLEGCHEDTWRFFQAVWAPSPGYASTRALAKDLAVCSATLCSRFFREGLPTPRDYMLLARLTRAARILEQPNVSVGRAATVLNASSPQSFNRAVRKATGLTPAVWRAHANGADMLARFREELILPHRAKLLAFNPLFGRPSGGRRACRILAA